MLDRAIQMAMRRVQATFLLAAGINAPITPPGPGVHRQRAFPWPPRWVVLHSFRLGYPSSSARPVHVWGPPEHQRVGSAEREVLVKSGCDARLARSEAFARPT